MTLAFFRGTPGPFQAVLGALQVIVDIDGDGSFLMNCQELATAAIEKMDIKMFILNNQHLGMVVQWEDRFYKVRPSPAIVFSLPGGAFAH